ncbi:MAG: 4Fe-4S dicluster domain-containing protein [Desulforhopalus sp.]
MADQKGAVQISKNLCKGCGLCVYVCPVHIIELDGQTVNAKGYAPAMVINPSGCTGCGNCTLMCPDSVITVQRFAGKGRRIHDQNSDKG